MVKISLLEVWARKRRPRQAANWVDDADLNPYRLVEGRAPRSADEVVINRGAASAGGLRLGDTTVVQTPAPVTVHIVGIATFGSADGFGSATFTAFILSAAQQHLLPRPGEISSILVKAAPGTSQAAVVGRIRAVLPPGDEAITGAQLTKENISDVNSSFVSLLRTFLVIFAA